jgi:hypothetical protein
MQQLRINVRSIFPFLIILIGTSLLMVWGITKLSFQLPFLVSILLSIAVPISASLIAKEITDGVLLISISNNDMIFKWDNKPQLTLLNLPKLELKNIVDYKMVSNAHFSIIKIILLDGSAVKIEGKSTDDDKNMDVKKLMRRLKNIKQNNIIKSKKQKRQNDNI